MKRRPLMQVLSLVLAYTMAISAISFTVTFPVGANYAGQKVFLPLVTNGRYLPPSSLPKVTGIIAQGYWDLNHPADINNLLLGADDWAGKKHTIAAFFYDLNGAGPDYHFRGQLEALWKNGYVPFVKLTAPKLSSYDIASGSQDAAIRENAAVYAAWVAQGGSRKAFLAPLPEMNGYWVTYGQDPGNYKIAYNRIRSIFERELAKKDLPTTSIWWGFIPNGWASSGHEFENYYPGDSKVDVVGFSSYNYGHCHVSSYPSWETAPDLYEPYVIRMRAMAPTKPVIITQTGTVGNYSDKSSIDRAKKDQWLIDTYNYVATREGLLGILYYDFDLSSWECDWTIYNTPSGVAKFEGYKKGVANPAFKYIPPAQLSSMNLVP